MHTYLHAWMCNVLFGTCENLDERSQKNLSLCLLNNAEVATRVYLDKRSLGIREVDNRFQKPMLWENKNGLSFRSYQCITHQSFYYNWFLFYLSVWDGGKELLWAIWVSVRCPCSWQGSWTRRSLQVPSTTHTVLWLCELVLPTCHFVSFEIRKFYFNNLFVLPLNTKQNTNSVCRPWGFLCLCLLTVISLLFSFEIFPKMTLKRISQCVEDYGRWFEKWQN